MQIDSELFNIIQQMLTTEDIVHVSFLLSLDLAAIAINLFYMFIIWKRFTSFF